MSEEYSTEQTAQYAGGKSDPGRPDPAPRRPLALYGIIVVLLAIILLLLVRSCADDGGGGGDGTPTPIPEEPDVVTTVITETVEVEVEVTRLVEVPGPEVTRLMTVEVPGPPTVVTTVITEQVPGPEVEVTRVVTEPGPETEVTRIVTRVVVVPPPPPEGVGEGCARFNLELGRNRESGAPLAGTYVMVQQPFDPDGNVVATWEAGVGALDSGWLTGLPLADEAVYVKVFFYPSPYGTPIPLEIVNPAPGTTYGWLANGVCHSVEIQFPADS